MKKESNNCGLGIIIGILAAIATIASATVAVVLFLDRKRKKEDKELEEYLESSIQ